MGCEHLLRDLLPCGAVTVGGEDPSQDFLIDVSLLK